MLIGTILSMREAGAWQFSLEERLQRSERQLRNQGELIRNVNDNTSELIFMKDRSGRLTYANAATLKAIGRAALNAETPDGPSFQVPEEYAAISKNDQHVLQTGEVVEVEEPHTEPMEYIVFFSPTKSPLRDENVRS